MTRINPLLRIATLSGSVRRNSFNTLLLAQATDLAPANVELQPLPSIGGLPLFSEDIEDEALHAGPVSEFCAAMAQSDALLIATPEYNQSMPGGLKNALDWLSRAPSNPMAGKPAAVIGATVGPWGTRLAQAQLRHLLGVLGMRVRYAPALYLAEAPRRINASTAAYQASVESMLAKVVESLADETFARRQPNAQQA